MAVSFNDTDLELVRATNFGHLSTLQEDGSPHSSVVWVDEEQGTIVITTAEDRVKTANIERDPRVALSVHRQENPYQSFAVTGRATVDRETGEEMADRLTKKFTGKDKFPAELRAPGEVRVTIRVVPETIHRYGY